MDRSVVFKNHYDIASCISSTEDFADLQSFAYGICSCLRGSITWPKIKERYEKFKKFLGTPSMMSVQIEYSQFRGLRSSDPQYLVYTTLKLLFEQRNQALESLRDYLQYSTYTLERHTLLTLTTLEDIWADSVKEPREQIVVPQKLNPEVIKMVKAIKKEERYEDLLVLADIMDDFHYYDTSAQKFVEHFRSGCLHTYGCKYLRVLPVK